MTPILQIDSVQSYNDYFGVETPHPLVSVIDGHEAKPLRFGRKFYHIYTVLLKDADCGTLKYGRSQYDYRRGTMLFIAPGQVMGSEDDGRLHQPEGWALCFHPEFLRRTPLAGLIKDYSFFSYNANEGLHLSEQERQTVLACLANIKEELRYPIDKHSKSLIIDNIKLLLDYCVRFYDRQFITREKLNSDILARLETLLDDYFLTGKSATDGLPTVQYCADRLCLSPNYLSDLLKKETGTSALKHIQLRTLEAAKARVFDPRKSLSEIAYELGFPYPQHFSRWFKKQTGMTPKEFIVKTEDETVKVVKK